MDLQSFRKTLERPEPPDGMGLALEALWWDAKGDFANAHRCAQERDDDAGMRVHAYLHRKEGDASNARYWYKQAGKPAVSGSLDQEWSEIAQTLLDGPLIDTQKKS